MSEIVSFTVHYFSEISKIHAFFQLFMLPQTFSTANAFLIDELWEEWSKMSLRSISPHRADSKKIEMFDKESKLYF